MEANEIQEFSNQLKEAGEKSNEESIMTISLAISILAVLVAMVTVLGHHVGGEAVLAQSRADDTWNQYQAKRIRSDQALVAVDLLSLQPSANAAAVQAKVAEYRGHLDKWKGDLVETEEKARELEAEVMHAEGQANRLEIGEALLQIAVVLCSITLFTRRKLFFFSGLSLGAVGLLVAATALLIH